MDQVVPVFFPFVIKNISLMIFGRQDELSLETHNGSLSPPG